jgi:hypothetical protein
MGNLLPFLAMLPFEAIGGFLVYRYIVSDTTSSIVLGTVLLLVGPVVGWLTVNRFGFFGNESLRREIQKKVLAKAGKDASSGIFVGFARPSYVGLLDAHEDLGFLFLGSETLEYLGEVHQVSIPRKDVKGVGYKANIHSALGLGRWISIDAVHKAKPVRVLVEPREFKTLLANKKRGAKLKREIDEWRKG